jgi:cytochrome c553
MKKTLATLFSLATLGLGTLNVQAASLVAGSAEAGKARSVTCGACHGPTGNSVNPAWPNLAGQGAPYILAQLKAFKEGTRSDPLMTSQAMLLSEQDMADLAVYFESQPAAVQAVFDASLVDKAEALYRGGNISEQTAACIACHGPTGRGNPAARYPALAGQHANYTAKQLRDYASGARQTDGKTRQMRDVVARLGEDEIAALASYIQGLR